MEVAKEVLIEKYWKSKSKERIRDIIPTEQLLKLKINGKILHQFYCSPGSDKELVVGYMISQNYISNIDQIEAIEISDLGDKNLFGKLISLTVDNFNLKNAKESTIINRCGKKRKEVKFDYRKILELNKKALSYQEKKKKFGGFHAVILFDRQCNFLRIEEDIGRHNCLDKIIGYMLLNDIMADDKILYTSGRIASEIINKISITTIPVIVSNSSVTHRAIAMAEKQKITAIGYARGKRFNTYSGFNKIIDNS